MLKVDVKTCEGQFYVEVCRLGKFKKMGWKCIRQNFSAGSDIFDFFCPTIN